MQHSSSCNHRHKSRKQWTVAGFAWILILNLYGFGLVSTVDKNDSVQQHPSPAPPERQPSFNDEHTKNQSPQVIVDDFLVRNERREEQTINSAADNPQVVRPPPPRIEPAVRDAEFPHDGSSVSVSVTDIEYLPQTSGETYQWEPTRTQVSVINNGINTESRKFNSATRPPAIESSIADEPTFSTVDSVQHSLQTSTAVIETSVLNQDDQDRLFEVLEEPSEVLYGVDSSVASTINPSATAVNNRVIETSHIEHNTTDAFIPSTNQQHFDSHTTLSDSFINDSEYSTVLATSGTDSPNQLISEEIAKEFETQVNATEQIITNSIETANNTEIENFDLTKLSAIESTETTLSSGEEAMPSVYEPMYTTTSVTDSAFDVELSSDFYLNKTSAVATATDEMLRSSFSITHRNDSTRSYKMMKTSDSNASIIVQFTEEIVSSPTTPLLATHSETLSSVYRLDFNETVESTAVQSSFQTTSAAPHFINTSSYGSQLVTKLPENINVHNEEIAESNITTENKYQLLTRDQHPVQQQPDIGFRMAQEEKPPLNNTFEKTTDSDVKLFDERHSDSQPPTQKNGSNDSKLGSSTAANHHQEIHTSQMQYDTYSASVSHTSMFTHLISPSPTLESPSPSSLSSNVQVTSTFWLQSSILMSTTAVINSTIQVDEISFPISTTNPITERPTVIKYTTKESYNEDKEHDLSPPSGKQQPILPTVQIPLAYLSVTMRCSWPYFCMNQKEFQKAFAKCLTASIKTNVADGQIVFFNINTCNQVSLNDNTVSGDDPLGTISLFVYVTDRKGVYSKSLTELLGLLMLKNKFKGFNENIELQDVVLAVQLHRKADPPEHHKPPMTVSHSSDMGIVAAVTISCIAGVCLLLLGILLVNNN